MIKGVIFDMDGVVIDSNHIIYENWYEVFLKQYHVRLSKKEFGLQLGKNFNYFTHYFIKKHGIKDDIDTVKNNVTKMYEHHRDRIELKDHIENILPKLKKNYKIALATGATVDRAEYLLRRLGVITYFNTIVGADHVKYGKPAPDIFLLAAKNLSLKKEECIIIEDALMGIQAAKAAGMRVISIPDEFTKYQDHSIADLQLQSIKELDTKHIHSLD